jgi:hypothetical protein
VGDWGLFRAGLFQGMMWRDDNDDDDRRSWWEIRSRMRRMTKFGNTIHLVSVGQGCFQARGGEGGRKGVRCKVVSR